MKAELIAEHYQKTFELTLTLWHKRNTTFIILLLVVGIGTLLTFNVNQAQPLLVDYIAKIFGIEHPKRLEELRGSFPYGLIQSIVLMVVLYLMIQLYHRTINITRNYRYLGHLENEIRSELNLSQNAKSFTREGVFYETEKPKFSNTIGIAYILILGILLFSFSIMRVYSDIKTLNILFVFIDLVLSLATIFYFVLYAHSSSSFVQSWFKKGRAKSKSH